MKIVDGQALNTLLWRNKLIDVVYCTKLLEKLPNEKQFGPGKSLESIITNMATEEEEPGYNLTFSPKVTY